MSAAAVVVCLLSFVVALAMSAILTPVVRFQALKRNFIDHPSGPAGHKAHMKSTALGGGIAITVAIVVPMVLALAFAALLDGNGNEHGGTLSSISAKLPAWIGGVAMKIPQGLGIIAGAIVLHIVGLIDDRKPVSARVKLIVQVAVALFLTAVLGIRSVEAPGVGLSVIISTIWIVGLTNAFNFLDNMDGLSAGVSVITAVVLAVCALLANQVFVPCVLMLVAGAACGFLVYNFPPAKIFMGDAGSMVLGYMLAVCTILTTFYDPEVGTRPFGILVPLVAFAIPLYDMLSVIVARLRRGQSIFQSDRGHFSHRLVRRGLSPRNAVLTVYLAALATSLPAILLPLNGWAVAILIVAQCLAVVSIIAILESTNGSRAADD